MTLEKLIELIEKAKINWKNVGSEVAMQYLIKEYEEIKK